jgi:zinc protease
LSFDTDTAKAEHLKPIIFKVIEKIKSSGPTAEDLDKVVKNLLKDREQAKPNNSYWMNMLTSYYRFNLNLDKPENYENILKSMTVKDVQKFAKKFFKKTDVVDLVFTPKE